VEVWLHALLTLELEGGECSAARPGCSTPQSKRRLGGPQSRCERGGKEKKSLPLMEIYPSRPAHNLATTMTELSRFVSVLLRI